MTLAVFPIFVGSGRSGTTVFRNIFNSHPDLAMTHEAHFIVPMAQHRDRYEHDGFDVDRFVADLYQNSNFVRQGLDRAAVRSELERAGAANFPDAVRAVFRVYARNEGKTLFGDKTPGYVNHIESLGGIFPEVKFVHIIRDGRDVALGYLDRAEWGPSTVAEAALYWRSRVSRGRRGGAVVGPDRYLEVRYEDLVEDPEKTTRRVCEFLSLDYHDAMLRFHEHGADFIAASATPEAFGGLTKPVTKGMRDWRIEMRPVDVALFEAIAGKMLSSLGYELAYHAPTPALRYRAALAFAAWQAKRIETTARPRLRAAWERATASQR